MGKMSTKQNMMKEGTKVEQEAFDEGTKKFKWALSSQKWVSWFSVAHELVWLLQ